MPDFTKMNLDLDKRAYTTGLDTVWDLPGLIAYLEEWHPLVDDAISAARLFSETDFKHFLRYRAAQRTQLEEVVDSVVEECGISRQRERSYGDILMPRVLVRIVLEFPHVPFGVVCHRAAEHILRKG